MYFNFPRSYICIQKQNGHLRISPPISMAIGLPRQIVTGNQSVKRQNRAELRHRAEGSGIQLDNLELALNLKCTKIPIYIYNLHLEFTGEPHNYHVCNTGLLPCWNRRDERWEKEIQHSFLSFILLITAKLRNHFQDFRAPRNTTLLPERAEAC